MSHTYEYARAALTVDCVVFGLDENDLKVLLIQRKLAPRGALQVVCGYRSPQTNAMLRRKMRGVASNSFHMYGKAVDLRIESCPLKVLHKFALGLEAGGVGYYPRSNFIHIDTGPPRTWNQGWGKRRSKRA